MEESHTVQPEPKEKDQKQINKEDFFPFTPYPTQKQFMASMLNILTFNKKIGLLESPTGTGKTLMLLSTAMTYLSNQFKAKQDPDDNTITSSEDNDWLNAFGKSPSKPLVDLSEEIENYRLRLKVAPKLKKNKAEKMLISKKPQATPISSQSKKLQFLFCTRTHSQIAQVIKESKRIRDYYQSFHKAFFPYSFSILGSRKHLCINSSLNKSSKASASLLNTKCKEMLEEGKCMFYSEEGIELLSKEINNKIVDIEELASLSKEISVCPYFACRNSIESSDFVVLPYSSLLSRTIRSNLNISLKGKVIIFDEAHNIIESMLQSYSTEITLEMLLSIAVGLILYYDCYSSRLKAENNLMLRQLITISEKVIEFMLTYQTSKKVKSGNSNINESKGTVIKLTDFSIQTNTTSYDLFALSKFIEDAELKDKVEWTIEKFISSNKTTEELHVVIKKNTHLKSVSLSQHIQSPHSLLKEISGKDSMNKFTLFLNGLTYVNDDGVIIVNEKPESKYPQLKFQMINPIREFEGIISEAKCIIFAGGTIKPFDDFKPLFTSLSNDSIETFEGDHVISPDALFIRILQSNPFSETSEAITFTYDELRRKQSVLIEMMLKVIQAYQNELNASLFKGKGIAVFVSSYDMLSKLIAFNDKAKIIPNDKGCLFCEKSNSDEQTFQLYKGSLEKNRVNAVIIAVIGGKLSEGINFSDDLARMVIVFGLPYPNINSIEIKQKMQYYDRLFQRKVLSTNGSEYYENICIKAVNQSIGRALRHSGDYAGIVLVDWRYSKEKIVNKLPKWLRKREITRIANKSAFEDNLKQFCLFLKANGSEEN